MRKSTAIRWLVRGCAVFALCVLVALCALVAVLWTEHKTVVVFPAPTGPFPVGRTVYDWVDDAHDEPLAPAPGTKRELLVWVWYPAAAGEAIRPADLYVPPDLRAADPPIDASFNRLQRVIVRFLRLLTRPATGVRSFTHRDAGMSGVQPSFPVLVLRGGASSGVLNYSILAEDLASHGYVVVGSDAAYRTARVVFPDGRIIEQPRQNNPEVMLERGDQRERLDALFGAWLGDIRFVLDRLDRLNRFEQAGTFSRRLDMSRVGVFGHSFGGAQAAQFCHDDSRCRAGIDVDGAPFGAVIKTGIDRPFMFLLSDHSGESDSESRRIRADIQSIYDRLPPDRRVRIAIRGAHHFLFTDDGALFKSRLVRGLLRLVGSARIDGHRQLAVAAYCVRTFFDTYLKDTPTSGGPSPSRLYPEIQPLSE